MTFEEYEEMPACEVNEFNTGDLVRVYTPNRVWEDRVIKCYGNSVMVQDAATMMDYSIVHFKQCRLLKEKERSNPREYWLYASKGGWYNVQTSPQPDGWIKTQTRCHKCGEDFNK